MQPYIQYSKYIPLKLHEQMENEISRIADLMRSDQMSGAMWIIV